MLSTFVPQSSTAAALLNEGTLSVQPASRTAADLSSATQAPATARGLMGRASSSAGEWSLDPALTFLNHGSYGAVPRAALRLQAQLRERLERDPVRFYKCDLEPMLDEMRHSLAAFLNCRAADLAPLPNATVALCTVLNNTHLEAGDEIVITDHEYQSLPNELDRICARTGAKVVKVEVPYPVTDAAQIVERFAAALTPRTRIAFISHVTSCTSLVFPVGPIVRELNARGIDSCVDGAHSPGQIPVDLAALKPTYFIGSGHKWLSGPKGIGFLYVRADKQAKFRPLQLSSRVSKVRHDRAMFLRDFDYQGTLDYTHILTLSKAIEAMGNLLPGGWPQLMRENHEKIMQARGILAPILEPHGCIVHTCPEQMVGTMSSIIVPHMAEHHQGRDSRYDDPLQDALYERHGIVTPVWLFNPTNARVVRISAQLYNTPEQYEYFGKALAEELRKER